MARKRTRDQWRNKPKQRRRKARKMPEAVKQELAENKAERKTGEDARYMERFDRSQVLHQRGCAQSRRQTQGLIDAHFRQQYGSVWREVKEGLAAEVEAQMAADRANRETEGWEEEE